MNENEEKIVNEIIDELKEIEIKEICKKNH